MNNSEFELIAKLLRSREPVKSAARDVLVNNFRSVDAAKKHDILPTSVSNTVNRFRNIDSEIRKVFCV